MFGQLIEKLKASPKTIVFTEGTDARILEASARLLSSTFLKPILIGNEQEVQAAAEKTGFNINGAIIMDPTKYDKMEEMVAAMVELRKGKMTPEQCRELLLQGNYFGTMLVKMGVADCLLGGATYSTADTVRPALQLIKTKPGNKIVSSCFIMVRAAATGSNEVLAMGDCAINIDPSEDDLVEIARECAHCARVFGIDPKVALLSYSTKGSGKGEDVDKMRNACLMALEFVNMLPPAETPAHTEGYEGFYHLGHMEGDETEARLSFIIRDHDRDRFESRKERINLIAAYLNEKYGPTTVQVELKDSYYNMKAQIEPHMYLIHRARAAFAKVGVEAVEVPIRGGTDGARLSYMGLPCPNLSTGGANFHGVMEYIPVQSMEKMVQVLVELVTEQK